jgi:glycosyltransferase involved in cell wall biosynthesis
MKISLLITTYNDPVRLKKTLSHCLRLRPQPAEILVCDDGSRPDTGEIIRSFALNSSTPVLHIFQDDHGWDAPGIRNLGAIRSSGDYLLMTDGDCVPHPRFISDHLAAAAEGFFVFGDRAHVLKEYVDGFSTRFDVVWNYLLRKRIIKRRAALRNPLETPRVFDRSAFPDIGAVASLAICCNLGVWKKDFFAVNGFDESFRKWWPEDAECSARLLNHGLKLKKFHQKCLVYHLDHSDTSHPSPEVYHYSNHSFLSGKTAATIGIRERLAQSNVKL